MNENMETFRKYTIFDFSNPQHSEEFFRFFGGEEHIKNNYPVLYSRYENAKRKDVSNNIITGYIDKLHLHELLYNNQNKNFFCDGFINLTHKSDIHITLEIFVNNESKGRNFKSIRMSQTGYLDCSSIAIQSISGKDKVYAVLTGYWTDTQKNSLVGASAAQRINWTGDEYIDSVDCIDPKKIKSQFPEKIRISFGRTPASSETIDYYFENSRDVEGNQRMFLNLHGDVKLKDGYTYSELEDFSIGLFSDDMSAIAYYGSDPKCIITPGGFKWSFDQDWKNVISSKLGYGNALFDLDMSISFKCKDNNGNTYLQKIIVTTHESTIPAKNTKIIKKLEFLWGCIAKDALVKMNDGSQKPISDVHIGDVVATPKGSALVSNVFSGLQDEIYVIRTACNKEIHVTADHPLMTSQGFVRACQLTSLAPLKAESGEFIEREDCYPTAYNDMVFSLELDGCEEFFVSGFVSGTFSVQNKNLCVSGDEKIEVDPEFDLIASDIKKRGTII